MAKPVRDNESDYRVVLANRRSCADKATLLAVQDRVFEAYQQYDEASGNPFKVTALPMDDVSARVLKGNYPHTYPGFCLEEISEEAFAAAPCDLCPMCGRVTPTTIDHFLPKDTYPEFSVFSSNLVPVCSDCNRYKSTLVGSELTGRFFHAYYDRLPDDVLLLEASVATRDGGVIILFSINALLPSDLHRNAQYQFSKLRLDKLYPKASVPELLERYDAFASGFASDGATGVAREARRIRRSIERNFGSQYWKLALYDGVAMSPSFCNGGFALLKAKVTPKPSRLPSTHPSR